MRASRLAQKFLERRDRLRLIALACVFGIALWAPFSLAFTVSNPHLDTQTFERPLSNADVRRYEKIFAFQTHGNWNQADQLIEQLDQPLLLGHVLAQRYLHPTQYRSKYGDLTAWLARYADHPDAEAIYRLALKRKPKNHKPPRRPESKKSSLGAAEPMWLAPEHRSTKKLTRSQRKTARRLKTRIRRYLRRIYLTKTEKLLAQPSTRQLLDRYELDEAYADLAAEWLYRGKLTKAFDMAAAVAKRSGHDLPISHWIAGLAAWRLGSTEIAVKHFEILAFAEMASGWNRAAGAYWAARAHLSSGDMLKARGFLAAAAEHSRTFYGLLARYKLGLKSDLNFEPPVPNDTDLDKLIAAPESIRALALVQVGETRRAEQEILRINHWTDSKVTEAMLALADSAGLAKLSMEIAQRSLLGQTTGRPDRDFDAALYPVPPWRPHGGFVLDRALIYAFMRQESSFDPQAKSPDGARGLMQLMPRTASSLDRKRRYRGRQREALFEPQLNIDLGQRYLKRLLSRKSVGNDIIRLAVAYNAGPGNLRNWERRVDTGNDPLLFIESLPTRETRLFVERVLTNLWIYRHRFGQHTPSLYALASGHWPAYRALDNSSGQIAKAR